VTSTLPTVTGPITGGRHGWSFGRPLADLGRYGYVESEYFVEGAATRYAPAAGTSLGRDGRWRVAAVAARPYKTRIVVLRPADAASFNGTVVASWNNVSAGYDLYSGDSLEILEGGYAFVGVTTQRVGVHGVGSTPMGLRAWDPERYGSLSILSDDDSYDIFTQAARVIGPDRPRSPVDPLGGLDVRHLVAQGGSQSAGRLATYVNAVHPLAGAFDAYLLTIYFGSGSGLQVGDFVIDLASPAVNRSPALRGSNLLRDDIDALVMVVNSELEAIACHDVRQPDTDRFRYWEAAGTCHVSAQGIKARQPKLARDFGSETQLPVPPASTRCR
jgi:Alpha/beta hydrolase domain